MGRVLVCIYKRRCQPGAVLCCVPFLGPCFGAEVGVIAVELQRQIADAVLAGAGVDVIEEAIIDPAPLDEEHKSALWLYAQALQARRSDRMLAAR